MLGPRSLKNRIVFLFVGLALVPFLVASFVLQQRANRELTTAISARTSAVVAGIQTELEAQVERAFSDAAVVGRAVAAGAPAGRTPLPARGLRRVRYADAAGLTVGVWTAPDSAFAGTVCAAPGDNPFVVRRTGVIPGSEDWSVEISLDPHWVLSTKDLGLFLGAGALEIADEAGFATTAESCPAAPLGQSAAADPTVLGPHFLVNAGWTIQALPSLSGESTPLGFSLIVILVGLLIASIATLLFALSVGSVTRSLNQLTIAADRIGEGDFTTWLPPPGDDEAGRLSFALSSMMTRVDRTMERMKRVGQMAAVGEAASYMTHEIRNPLSSLRLNLQSIERSAGRMNLNASSGRSLEICLKQVDRLEAVASGVLRLGRYEVGGALDLSWTHAVIRDAVELLKPEFDRRDVTIAVDLAAADDTIRCDAQRLEAVFINLLLNAAEAMPSGGSMWVRTSAGALDGRPAINIRVSDSGPGVPSELRSRIFEPFFTTREGGSGVGLSVAAQTIHDHGGTIHVGPRESVVEGAVFEVVLPLAADLEEGVQESPTYDWPFAAKPGSPPRRRRTLSNESEAS